MSEGRCPDIRSYNYIPNCFWIHHCEETAQKPTHPDPVFPNDPKQETKGKKAVPKTHKKVGIHCSNVNNICYLLTFQSRHFSFYFLFIAFFIQNELAGNKRAELLKIF
ncbi:unnamed protein product [Caretta caretta]